MTVVPFGDEEDHAIVLYDRKAQVCVIVANKMTHLQDALAVINSIRADHCWVIAPLEAFEEIRALKLVGNLELYEYVK